MTAPWTTGRPVALPPLLLLTDRSQVPVSRTLTDVVAECVDAGLRAVVVRERDLEDRERADLVHDLARLLGPVGGVLLVGAPELGRPDGVHLRSVDPPPRIRPPLLGRSCHDAQELRRAAREGCDYVTLSPVAASASKPGHGPPLGAAGLHRVTRHARTDPSREAPNFRVPGPRILARHARVAGADRGAGAVPLPAVYALGGVTPGNAADWLGAGADGIAVMGAVMRAEDPGAVTARLLAAVAHVMPDATGAEDRPETPGEAG